MILNEDGMLFTEGELTENVENENIRAFPNDHLTQSTQFVTVSPGICWKWRMLRVTKVAR